jgi:hypothetical protein
MSLLFCIALTISIILYEDILGTKISPPTEFFVALRTNLTASSKSILNLVISGSVIINFCFLLIRSKKKGITDPRLPNTFPYLTTEKLVFFFPTKVLADKKSLSAHNFVAPYKLIGDDALSVDKAITFFTFNSIAASIIFCDPITFVLTNSIGLYSAVGTYLRAAAWIT